MSREVEHESLSECAVAAAENLIIKPNENDANNWTELPETTDTSILNANAVMHSIVPYTYTPEGATIRVQPMEWYCGGWDPIHFHSNLRLPLGSPVSKGMVVTLEAMARECVAVALSPQPSFELGKTYAIHIGAASNIQTVIRRRLVNGTQAVDVIESSPQICSSDKYVSYWIILQGNGQLSVGIGKTPGKNCIASLDDSMYHALRSGVDAVKYVGIGNSALGRKARDLKVRNVRVMPVPDAFAAFSGIPITPYDPLAAQKEMDEQDAELWAEYQKECDKAKKRAMKFGIEYKQPAPDAFFKWSEARRLRANPEKGFITGMDIQSAEEQEKARKRKERFEEEEKKNKADMGMADESQDNEEGMEDDDNQEEEKKKRDPLPLEQAWDNEELVGDMRVDPPTSLYLYPIEIKAEDEVLNEGEMAEEDTKPPITVPNKIHLFAIDWAAFKQIRTDDIMAFFKIYGPSYVEWLGELSCNIHFGDKYSASRALEALSRPLPVEIPLKREHGNDANNQESGDDAVMNTENVEVKVEGVEQPSGEQTSGEDAMDAEKAKNVPISATNLGAMGWRMCNYPIRKIHNDRYGRRGTRSRCIVRVATSIDVLDERPTQWPKPPPGYTTKAVLGPGNDFRSHKRRNDNKRRRNGGGGKRRRRSHGGSYEQQEDPDDYYLPRPSGRFDSEPDEVDEFGRSALDRGLNAAR